MSVQAPTYLNAYRLRSEYASGGDDDDDDDDAGTGQ